MRIPLIIFVCLSLALSLSMFFGCSAGEPWTEEQPKGSPAALEGTGGTGGTGGASTSTSTSSGGGSDAGPVEVQCSCDALVQPRMEKPIIKLPYTGFPPVACDDHADCAAVAGCRHSSCNVECGFCQFVDVAPCSVDHCPGHNSTCVTDTDCSASPYYSGVSCLDGKCVVLPSTLSGYDCEGPGDLYHE